MIECTHDAACLLTATLIAIEMTEGRPACTACIFKLHLQNIKIPETYIIRLYLYLSCVVRISLTHFLCVCVCVCMCVLLKVIYLLYSLVSQILLFSHQKAQEVT